MQSIPWDLVWANAGSLAGSAILWGALGGVAGLAIAVGLSVALSKVGALRVGFSGAGFARGAVHGWIALVCLFGGATLGAVRGGTRALEDVVRSPAFTAAALRPAARPIAAGLVHAVAIQIDADPRPMLDGTRPVPSAPLRAVLAEPTGAAAVGGLRRVPELRAIAESRGGGFVVAFLAERLAGEHAAAMLDAVGLLGAMRDAKLPAGDAVAITALAAWVERALLPEFVAGWIGRAEAQVQVATVVPALVALAAPIGLLWAIEGLVRLARARRPVP